MFRYGYSIQERIINFLKDNSKKNIIELPNIIFYKKNTDNKMYSEMDRNIIVDQDTEINNFFVYLKVELNINKKNKMDIIEFPHGEILSLKKGSCYFIEVKSSIYSLFEKEKKEPANSQNKNKEDSKYNNPYDKNDINKENNKNNIIEIKTPSDLLSNHSNPEYIPKKNNKIYKNMKAFKDLFDKLGYHFQSLNLVIIIDSYFPKNFLDLSKKFVEIFKEEYLTFNFNIYIVHFEIHIEYIHQLTTIEKIEKELKNKDKEIEKVKKELANESEKKDKEIEKVKKELANESEKTKVLQKEIEVINTKLYNMAKKERLKEMKKKIKKDFENFMREEIKKSNKKITKDECLIITEHQIPDFNYSRKLISDIKYKSILDFKTFCLLYYKIDNKDLIDDVKIKHFKNITKYSQKKGLKFLLFLVDFVFLYSIKELREKIGKYKMTVESAPNSFFLVKIYPNKSNTTTCLFLEEILGTAEGNLDKFIDTKNFTDYYLQIQEIKNQENLTNFPIYNPITNGYDSSINIQKTSETGSDKCLVIIVDSVYEYKSLNFNFKEKYKYYLIVFKNYDSICYSEDIILNMQYHFSYLKKLFSSCILIEENGKKDYEDEYKYVKIYPDSKIACIFDKSEKKLQFKYKINENKKINKELIIDQKIGYIMKIISEAAKLKKLSILIEEPFNFIYTYIKAKQIDCNLFLINNSGKEQIIDYLSTKAETKNVDINIYSYLDKCKKDLFDFIILLDNHFPDKDTDIIPRSLFIHDKKLKNISKHLNEGGKFLFNLLMKNHYLKEKIEKKLNSIFKNVYFKVPELDSFVVCLSN